MGKAESIIEEKIGHKFTSRSQRGAQAAAIEPRPDSFFFHTFQPLRKRSGEGKKGERQSAQEEESIVCNLRAERSLLGERRAIN